MRILVYTKSLGKPTLTFIFNELKMLSKSDSVTLKIVTEYYENKNSFFLENVSEIASLRRISIFESIWWKLYKSNIRLNYYNLPYSRSINSLVAEFEPDIIHCHFGDDALMLWDNLNSKNKKIVFFPHFHGYDASNKLFISKIYQNRLREFLSLNNINPIFVSNYMYNNMLKERIIPRNKKILYYGTDTKKFLRTKKESTYRTFLQVSSLVEKKGHVYTLKAFKMFLDSVETNNNYTLTITGDGENLDILKNLAKDLNILEKVNFLGWVDVPKAIELMNEADFFLHHSVTGFNGDKEGIPNAIMEAMAMKLPVISTFHSGIPELVEDGVNGYLVEEKDVKNYSKRMKDILNWGYLEKNRLKVDQLFEKSKHLQKLLNFYQESLNEFQKF